MHLCLWKFTLILSLALASGLAFAEAKHIQKWVDDHGVTHYGDVIPPQYAGEKTSEINSQGITVKRRENKPNAKDKSASKTPEVSEQERRDKALLNSFTTAKEIDLARDRNLQLDQATVQSLQQRLGDAEKRLDKTNSSIAEFSKNKKPVPADLTDTQKLQQQEIEKIKEQIARKQANMDATRTRFENDKKRFIELKSGTAPEEPAATPEPGSPAASAPPAQAAQ
ncbi:MAG TPA: DUF4124 domain-containing protein [Methylophilaceae bacterium]|nr:DUF4124 domain-containing protein [Methylophilaceae bacterium]